MSKFLLVDAHALIYRAYYAIPNLTDPNGHLVNAVYGFSKMMLGAINYFEPEYAAVCFDHKSETFRKQKYKEYKAQRAKMPDDLIPQIQIVKDVVQALSIPQFEIPGFEADDLIGTVNCKVEDSHQDLLTVIMTGDQDAFQLVDDNTHVFMPARAKQQGDMEYDADLVVKRLGLLPSQVVDYKALRGDTSDNIPGVRGIGPKTALQLLQRFDNLENLYQFLDAHPEGDAQLKGAVLSKLLTNRAEAFLSQDLARIDCNAPVDFDLEKCRLTAYDKKIVSQIFNDLGFKSLHKMLPQDDFDQAIQEALF